MNPALSLRLMDFPVRQHRIRCALGEEGEPVTVCILDGRLSVSVLAKPVVTFRPRDGGDAA